MNAQRLLAALGCAALLGVAAPPSLAPAPQAAVTPCTPTAFAPAGTRGPRAGARGPALVLAGAGLLNMSPAVMPWMRAHIRGARGGRAGNLVVLKASGERDYSDDFYVRGNFAWVQEILVPPCASPRDVDAIAAYVDDADALLFAGGDQSHYTAWKSSALIRAVRRLYARGGIVGGGSAGLAIQGAVVYDSVAADALHPNDDDYAVTTANALASPLEPEISFTVGLFDWPALRGTITDSHFVKRNRFGRTVVFLARIVHDRLGAAPVYALGIDEGSAVLVEPDGTATVRIKGEDRGAYLVRLSAPPRLTAGAPMRAAVAVAHVARDGEHFDLARHAASEPWHAVTVDGRRPGFYEQDPYR